MTAEAVQITQPAVNEAARYALEGIVDEAEITERDAMIAVAVYAKAYREGVVSTEDRISDLEAELNSSRKTRRIK